ncbi:hypothetical protein QBC45DRAFT_395212 [Copromyces sp. CBS 386.78]|nr:hypothetical protein QBC45DRAFT_395212 [Copromyces sp. CBS 386.78]
MRSQLLFSLLFSFCGPSDASVIKSPRDPSGINTLTTQTANPPTRTASFLTSIQPVTTTVSNIGKTDTNERSSEEGDTPEEVHFELHVRKRQEGQPPSGGAGAGAGTGGEEGQPPEEKPKPTHDPLPIESPSNSGGGGGGGGGGKADIGAIIGGSIAGVVGLVLLICVFKGIKARREDQEESDEEYEMRRQRRRSRR